MVKHAFFDLDNTLTESRSLIDESMATALRALTQRADVVVVSGARDGQIRTQLGDSLSSRVHILSQNGNHAKSPEGTLLWERNLSREARDAIHAYAHAVLDKGFTQPANRLDCVEDRGSQISFSLIGHNAQRSLKEEFDPMRVKRKDLLVQMPFYHPEVEVSIGGTTCFDFYPRGFNKGSNIQALLSTLSFDKEKCLYVGDALEPGGNDASVVGIIPTLSVSGPRDTLREIQKILEQ